MPVSVQPNHFCSTQGKFALFSYKLKAAFVQLSSSHGCSHPCRMDLAALHSPNLILLWGTELGTGNIPVLALDFCAGQGACNYDVTWNVLWLQPVCPLPQRCCPLMIPTCLPLD